MNLKGKVSRLLTEAKKMLPTEKQEREIQEEQEKADAWWHSVFEALKRIGESLPEELQEVFVQRIEQRVNEAEAGDEDWNRDGLIRWASKTIDGDEAPLPEALPAALAKTYLDDPEALPCHECGECGLIVPTDRQRRVEYFPTCPVCGGRTGLLAWFHAIHEAVKLLPYEKASPAICGKVSALTVLIEAGYQPGTRLSDWEKQRQQEV
ncbi:MAG TPA: hypothetical protein VH643_28375 [Gemmataceae bacterium]|jgi:hypothetical protein